MYRPVFWDMKTRKYVGGRGDNWMVRGISVLEYRRLSTCRGDTRSRESAPKRRRREEEELQRTCIEWAGLMSCRYPSLEYLFHVPNGGKRTRGEAGKLKGLGTKRGVPDLLLPFPGGGFYVGLAVECKAPDGRLSDEQGEWLRRFEEAGWMVGVCRTLDEFIQIVDRYLHGRPTGDLRAV